jgi:hypothetical protein
MQRHARNLPLAHRSGWGSLSRDRTGLDQCCSHSEPLERLLLSAPEPPLTSSSRCRRRVSSHHSWHFTEDNEQDESSVLAFAKDLRLANSVDHVDLDRTPDSPPNCPSITPRRVCSGHNFDATSVTVEAKRSLSWLEPDSPRRLPDNCPEARADVRSQQSLRPEAGASSR